MMSDLAKQARTAPRYASTRGQARLLAGVTVAQLAAVLISAVADEAPESAWADTLTFYGGYAAMLLLFAGLTLFVDWARRATNNLRALGTMAPSFAGAQVVVMLMVPLAN